ncbi:MAG: ketopantoate reductase family protein [Mogibacterium sp.]|nr:ketopantoate reductase family protein [Mogibacterium sp.]
MIKTVGIAGAGSVGSALMYEMYHKDPENVYLVATGERAERMREKGISVNNEIFFPKVYSDRSQGVHLDLVIIAVKTYSLESLINDIRPLLDRDTLILPIENGITTTQLFEREFPDNRVFYGVVLRTDAHRMSRRVYFNTLGEMQIGYADNHEVKPEVQEAYERLRELGVNVRIYEDMRRAKWRKWMLNTGASQTAVEVQAECGFFGQVEEVRSLMAMLMDEIIAVGRAEGVDINEDDRDEIIEMLVNFPPDKKMSMLQDVEAGRPIEIDEYAGEVVRLGRKHGIPTPANEILYLAITAREKISELRKA